MNLKDIFLDARNVIIIILLLVCVGGIIFCIETKKKKDIYKNNIEALTDSLSSVKLENETLLYQKKMLILDKDDVEKMLGISNKKIKELEKKTKSDAIYIAELESSFKLDTIVLHDSTYISQDTVYICFDKTDKWYAIFGNCEYYNGYSKTTINRLSIDVPLTLGITENNKIFANSDNPYVSFSSINAAALDKNSNVKPKRWGIGPFIGVGVGYGFGTDFNGGNVGGKGGLMVGITAGISIHYSIFQW